MIRAAFRLFAALIALLIAANLAFAAAIAAPQPFFAHSVSAHGLTLHADRPLDEAAARARLAETAAILSASPFGGTGASVGFFAAHDNWRERLFFLPVPMAGGVVYTPFSHKNAFLTDIDEANDRLIKGTITITPPRTLTYYMVHEAVHLLHAQRLGTIGFETSPRWVREGLADLIALGPMPKQMRAALRAGAPDGMPSLAIMKAHGSYPLLRADVSDALEAPGCTFETLLTLRITTDEHPCL